MAEYTLDLTQVRKQKVYPLGDRFCGASSDGHEISFTNVSMQKDGRPFFAVSGELHFSRVSPDQWDDSVVKMQCGGVNILSTYVFWIVHEEEEGVFRFDGRRDLRAFLSVCQKRNMQVILRIGPFAHGEMRNGGLPDWLYGKPFDVREYNEGFLGAVRRYFRAIHRQVDGYYFHQGGCVIAIQIENEYQHSSAPWEITSGVSNEWICGGTSGEKYMLALKKIMLEEGIRTPFYTSTAWGGAVTPVEEALPLWGGYSYQPWLFYSGRQEAHPATPEYIYRDNHNSRVTSAYNFSPSYDPESRPYACCEMMGGMMCSYRYRFQLDMRAVDALANTKLGSGCNLLGYYMYRGGTTPGGKCTPYLNEGQISKRSYDYQAAIGEFGQIRESYGRMRAIHALCEHFTPWLQDTVTVLPSYMNELDPRDTRPLRYAVRVKEDRGLVFINNFQDHLAMPDRAGEVISLELPGEKITFPVSIAGGENAILPFNMPMGPQLLKWATAQLLGCVGDVWFFFAPDGMDAMYCVEGKVYPAKRGEVIRIGAVRVMTLGRLESSGFAIFDIHGRKTAFYSTAPLLWDGEQLNLEMQGEDAFVYAYPPIIIQKKEPPAVYGVMHGMRVAAKRPGGTVAVHKVGSGRYSLSVDCDTRPDQKQILLRLAYKGDIGSMFFGNEMISDNMSNGAPWEIRVDPWLDQGKAEFCVYITPRKENVTVDASAMAGLQEHADVTEGVIEEASLVFVSNKQIPLNIG